MLTKSWLLLTVAVVLAVPALLLTVTAAPYLIDRLACALVAAAYVPSMAVVGYCFDCKKNEAKKVA